MKVINQQFQVNYQYPVIFSQHLFQQGNTALSDFLAQYLDKEVDKKVLLVLDEGMLFHYSDLQEDIKRYFKINTNLKLLPFIVVPGGEKVKNDPVYYEKIIKAVNYHKIDRHSFLIGIGGGAVLDLVGYAAATAHRGIRHIRIPTTVLSQNDSGVGVKNGINFLNKKNFLGTFAPPFAVFNDTHFLTSLDNRNWRSGIAEAIKVALIKDAAFFAWIEDNALALSERNRQAMEYLVFRCAELHLQHISGGDPFENGSSRPLDFGHWSAHKLEQLSDFSVLHGEAVAIGIALDVVYSQSMGWLRQEEQERILRVLQKVGFQCYHPLLKEKSLCYGLTEFREHLGGQLTIMMLRSIGKGENVHQVDSGMIQKSITFLQHVEEGILK